jgi:hypothetical protein
VPLSAERLIQCEAAKRFIADPHFNALLDRMANEATKNAVFLDDASQREACRQLVLALRRLWQELEADAEAPEADAAAALHSQSME